MSLKCLNNRRFPSRHVILFVILSVAALCGCSEPRTYKNTLTSAADPILQERSAKDASFRSDEGSPIAMQDRPGFKGLFYYPVNPALRFSVKLHRYPGPETIRLATNTGEIRSGLRYGYFEFQVNSRTCRLQVYKLEDAPDRGASLFIPFRDMTSGGETYGAGRYIDLKENTSGIYDLDFNRAYNPYCAYNKDFSCPVPPTENTLAVPILAGERMYVGKH